MRNHDDESAKLGGFTRVDLLAIAVIVFLFTFLIVPTLARGRDATQSLACLNNLAALGKAWHIYAEENDGIFPKNPSIGQTSEIKGNEWAVGYLDWTNRRDNTNSAILAQLPFSGYLPNIEAYRCPSDVYRSSQQLTPRIRSYSMNSFIASDGTFQSGWRNYHKVSDLVLPEPSKLFVLIQEHPDSLNDPLYVPPMDSPTWLDLPFSAHDSAGSLVFADGHADSKLWQPPTRVPVRFVFSPAPVSTADTAWLRERSTARP